MLIHVHESKYIVLRGNLPLQHERASDDVATRSSRLAWSRACNNYPALCRRSERNERDGMGIPRRQLSGQPIRNWYPHCDSTNYRVIDGSGCTHAFDLRDNQERIYWPSAEGMSTLVEIRVISETKPLKSAAKPTLIMYQKITHQNYPVIRLHEQNN